MTAVRDEIASCCKRLRLSRTLAENLDRVDKTDRELFLLRVLQQEVDHRDETRKYRYLKAAGFYGIKTFDGYVFDDVTLPTGLTTESLKNLHFLEETRNLIL